ncbi:MAG: hypothetical protein QF749_01400 [Verrucomicrobiota bacterium]|nr:hypothetical protein [Verrucomicrobiota bacterium]MDP7176923.1 hypothetical protein [Verrucomicrobiota bacterium]MDP7293432.1 hypothetical protein [Verrucomicrobiota bacterium]MDP7440837.1 hypothetical protein [Verrucomicrobiota bacterium]
MTTLSTLTPLATPFTSRSGRALTTLGTLTLFTSCSGRAFTTLGTFTPFAPTAFLRDCITCHHAKTCDSHH